MYRKEGWFCVPCQNVFLGRVYPSINQPFAFEWNTSATVRFKENCFCHSVSTLGSNCAKNLRMCKSSVQKERIDPVLISLRFGDTQALAALVSTELRQRLKRLNHFLAFSPHMLSSLQPVEYSGMFEFVYQVLVKTDAICVRTSCLRTEIRRARNPRLSSRLNGQERTRMPVNNYSQMRWGAGVSFHRKYFAYAVFLFAGK